MSKKFLAWLMLIFSLAGFLDSVYLTLKHYQGTAPVCSLIRGCDLVTTSQYAVIANLPISLIGAVYYLTIFIFALIYLEAGKIRALWVAGFLTPLGFFVSIFLVYLQLFVIKAICLYCLLSALTSTLLFIAALGLLLLRKNHSEK